MNFFEKELRGMFQRRKLLKDSVFCGKAMLAKLDDELRIRLEFVISNTIDEYTGIEAKIINRTGGMVDRNVFRFADIIGMKETPMRGKCEPYIRVYHDETDWYAGERRGKTTDCRCGHGVCGIIPNPAAGTGDEDVTKNKPSVGVDRFTL